MRITRPFVPVVDLDRDGREDIIGERCGYAAVTYYQNTMPPVQ